MTRPGPSARFELVGLGGGAGPELLGLWAPTEPAGEAAFAAGSGEPDVTLWRVRLPADAEQAAAVLADADARLERVGQALSDADRRLQAVARAPATAPAAAPEAELLALLGSAGRPVGRSAGQPLVYGLLPDRWLEAARGFGAFATQQLAATTRHGRVDTYVGEQLVGCSVVGLAGALHTVLALPLDPARAALHQRTVGLTIVSRTAFIRLTIIVVRGATILATALSSPVGPAVALPAAWKFVGDVLGEAQWLKTQWQAAEPGTRSS
jgi:hypothetical protein